jgi:glucose-6-phosphate-specific signal transduction histidine kinase
MIFVFIFLAWVAGFNDLIGVSDYLPDGGAAVLALHFGLAHPIQCLKFMIVVEQVFLFVIAHFRVLRGYK